MSVLITLTLEVNEMFLYFPIYRAAVVWAIPERISDLDPSLELIDPKYLKLSIVYYMCIYNHIRFSTAFLRICLRKVGLEILKIVGYK